jgi:hypothetical protein
MRGVLDMSQVLYKENISCVDYLISKVIKSGQMCRYVSKMAKSGYSNSEYILGRNKSP